MRRESIAARGPRAEIAVGVLTIGDGDASVTIHVPWNISVPNPFCPAEKEHAKAAEPGAK